MIEIFLSNPAALQAPIAVFSGEDHKAKELGPLRGGSRAPRRSQTCQDYKPPEFPLVTIQNILHQLQVAENQVKEEKVRQEPVKQPTLRLSRPPIGPRRRSYSVTDKEPVPAPSAGLTLSDLPPELHYAIFDFLDPIDSTCLGLTNKHFYAIHRRMRGTVPLSTRREGPNDLEWAWHLAARVSPSVGANNTKEAVVELKERLALSKLRVRGQGYCRKCGVTRCQLHKHIQSWMGEDAEYCAVKQKFGQAAPEGAKAYCYMPNPRDVSRCGRHCIRRSKVVLK